VAIHNILRQSREQAGLTLEQAAECIGISGALFSRMKNGLSRVTTERLEMLARLYGVSASALVEESIVMRPSTLGLARLKAVVHAVQGVVNSRRVKPSPEKMAMAVSEPYRLEIAHIVSNPKTEFDPDRHIGIIDAMFRK